MSEGCNRGDAKGKTNPSQLARETQRLQHRYFKTGATLPVSARRDALRALLGALERREQDILDALSADLRKPPVEAWLAEFQMVRSELRQMIRWLPWWSRRRRAGHPFYLLPASSRIHREPFGTSLVISPWNYPLQLSLAPAMASLAAGNCVTIKPAELSPASGGVLREIFAEAGDPGHMTVLEGGADLGAALLDQSWDFFFFTGGEAVGRKVAEAAARQLAPCVLELGGKSPAFIDWTADLKVAAERIGAGKFLNAGQTCMAPDFVAVPDMLYDEFVGHLNEFLKRAYEHESPDLASCPNREHYDRVLSMAEGKVHQFGNDDEASLRLAPRWVEADWDHPSMKAEVFGPLLPIVRYGDRAAFIDELAAMPAPLALYLFTDSGGFAETLMERFRSGSVCVNDVMKQAINPSLPFGGVGPSGHGRYRGRHGYETFSLTRPVTRRLQIPDPFTQAPPYGNLLERLRKFVR